MVALGAAVVCAEGAFRAVAESRTTFRYARRHAGETFEASQDRLFGRDYMESLRAVRSLVPPSKSLFFVDEKHPDGSSYFALHYLAPRRLLSLEAFSRRQRRLRAKLRPGFEVLVVPNDRAPVRLLSGPELSAWRARARGDRP